MAVSCSKKSPFAVALSNKFQLYIISIVEERPEYVAISPMAVVCSRCGAEPGQVCEVLAAEGLEIVHIERIKLALAMDVEVKARLARVRGRSSSYFSEPSE
jgi:hypothetical protein